jgi:hypothetical protein
VGVRAAIRRSGSLGKGKRTVERSAPEGALCFMKKTAGVFNFAEGACRVRMAQTRYPQAGCRPIPHQKHRSRSGGQKGHASTTNDNTAAAIRTGRLLNWVILRTRPNHGQGLQELARIFDIDGDLASLLNHIKMTSEKLSHRSVMHNFNAGNAGERS